MSDLKNFRTDYGKQELNRKDLPDSPIILFKIWLSNAMDIVSKDANAFTLSTVDHHGMPNSRVLLLKEFNSEGFVFFTNYNSQKGQEIKSNKKVCMNFFWSQLERQVRVQGIIEKVSKKESDTYFKTRPYNSQIGAWASKQSSLINNRDEIVNNFKSLATNYPKIVPRPPYWGGYIVKPIIIEFWQGRSSRLHDRFRFTFRNEKWISDRLSP